MKTLLLMTHGESTRENKLQDDWYRALSSRGKMEAFQIGELLVDKNLIPDLILASSAVRAQQTARIVEQSFPHCCDLYCQDNLYLAEMEVYFQEIQKLPDRVKNLMVVGHNPALDRIRQVITETFEPFPPSAAAYVAVSINSWKDFKYDVQGDLLELIRAQPTFLSYKTGRAMAAVAASAQHLS
jgi:phosphohistidine phosphatase